MLQHTLTEIVNSALIQKNTDSGKDAVYCLLYRFLKENKELLRKKEGQIGYHVNQKNLYKKLGEFSFRLKGSAEYADEESTIGKEMMDTLMKAVPSPNLTELNKYGSKFEKIRKKDLCAIRELCLLRFQEGSQSGSR